MYENEIAELYNLRGDEPAEPNPRLTLTATFTI